MAAAPTPPASVWDRDAGLPPAWGHARSNSGIGGGGSSASGSGGFCAGAAEPPSAGRAEGVSFTRWALEGEAGGLVVALHPWVIAVVKACRPEAVLLHPVPRRKLGAAYGACAGGREGDGAQALWQRSRTLAAPSGPLSALRFHDCAAPAGRLLLLAAAPREAYLWDVSAECPEPLPLLGVEAPLSAPPGLGFDETGALAVLGGIDPAGAPRLAVFHTSDGSALAQARVPACPGELAPDVAVTACCFLRGDFAFALVSATHTGGQHGSVLVHDLRGCGTQETGGGFQPSHETSAMAGAPFLAMCPHQAQGSVFLLGGCAGVIRMLQVRSTSGSGLTCSQLAEIPFGDTDVPVWLRSGAESEAGDCVDSSDAVLALEAIPCSVSGGPASLGLCGTLAVAVTAGAVYAIWGHKKRGEHLCDTPALGAAAACTAPGGSALLATYLHAFAGGGEVVSLALSPELRFVAGASSPTPNQTSGTSLFEENGGAPSDPPICSVTPLGPIPESSALGRALMPSQQARAPTPKAGAVKRCGSAPNRSPTAASNQPVTFHRKVKSAGYGPPTEPPRKLGQPRLSASRATAPQKPDFGRPPSGSSARSARPRSATGQGRGSSSRDSYVAAGAGPPLEHCPDQSFAAYSACAATDLCYTPQVTHLIVTGSDWTVSAYRLPLSRTRVAGGPPRPFGLGGHKADVTSLCPSYTDSHSTGGGGSPLLLTSAADRTARLWALGGTHAGGELICFDRLRTNTKPAQKDDNPALDQVQDSHFLCLDGAIAVATGNRLAIYKYELHVQDTGDDIKRLQRLGSYRCCGLLALPREPSAGHSIVAIAANNAVMSGTVLVASSSRRVYVWDVAAERVLASIRDGSLHSRPITCLRLAQPHVDFQSVESMDLFYTAAMDNTVRLWDLRSMQECGCFEGGHTHSAQRLRCRLSPCLRYLCVPSEDGCVCAYDVRTGNVLGSRHCHRDAVGAVDIHPRSGCMASSGFDGKVHLYRSPLSEAAPSTKGRPPGNLLERPMRVRQVDMDLPV